MQYSTCQDNALGNIVKNEERRVCTKVNWKKGALSSPSTSSYLQGSEMRKGSKGGT